MSPPAPTSGARNPRFLVAAVVALVVTFLLGVVVGRGMESGDTDVQAAGPKTGEEGSGLLSTSDLDEDDGGSPWIEDTTGGTPAATGENALLDPRNKYTIVAISMTPANEDLAWVNHDHLEAQGLPVFPPFPTSNGMLVVVVGAAAKESDLDDARTRLKRLTGPNGTGRPYEDAYPYPIRKLIQTDADD